MAALENFRLVVFRKVADQLSFRKAAEELYLTQPAVSLQIKALEEDLGVNLFDRTGSQIGLTAAGDVLLRYAEQVSSLLSQAEGEIVSQTCDHSGHLALGASTTVAQYVLPGFLGNFQKQFPRVHTTLISGNTEQVVAALEDKKIALGLIEGPARSRGVKTEPFLKDSLVLIASSAHELAERPSIACADLKTAPMLMRERGSGTRRVVEMALERHGIKRNSLNITMELDSSEAIKSAVEAGLGIGFISRWAIAKDLRLNKSFKIVEVEGLNIQRNFLLACVTGPTPSGLVKEFRRFLLSRADAHVRRGSAT
jgi:LysR family transcriptional regulator, transcriptional activator of the cysJI operon